MFSFSIERASSQTGMILSIKLQFKSSSSSFLITLTSEKTERIQQKGKKKYNKENIIY